MKFGSVIKHALYSEWQESYVDYTGLKRFIKDRQVKHKWDDADEADFVEALEGELDKVVKFQESKISELTEQISMYESQVLLLIANSPSVQRVAAANALARGETVPAHESAEDANLDEDEDDEATEDQFVELEEDLANVIADVHDLGHFSHLNYTGFVKIVKKHDKKTGFALKGQFMREYLSKRPFYKENYDSLIVQLSRLYNLVRTRGHPVLGDSSAGGGQSAFVRQTTKYWVHPDNYVQLKLVILKHLPVLVFDALKPFDPSDAAITSIYFDNPSLDLYLGRLEKTEGAQAIRLRWYGPVDTPTIFVERKTHREDWTGEKSVKARFPIKEHQVNDYLAGRFDMTETFEAVRKRGKKSDKEVDAMIQLAREVQEAVKNKDLQPVMRTFYNRTAFQLPGDARVRISFDTQLSLVREDSFPSTSPNVPTVVRAGDNWRRTDIGIDFPFDQLAEGEKELFPYGVLEVKLQTQMGQEPPEWVRELVSSHLVEAVPKFSKFIHGCSTLLPERVDLIPFWLPQMETDIRKPAGQKASISRPVAHPSNPASSNATRTSSVEGFVDYTEPVSDDEDDDEDNRLKGTAVIEADWVGGDIGREELAAAKAFRENHVRAEQASNANGTKKVKSSNKVREIFTKLTPANLARLLDTKYALDSNRSLNTGTASAPVNGNGEEEISGAQVNESGFALNPGRIEYISSFRAGPGKRIAIPVRIEPKVFFANERTTLAWVEFSVVVSAIGMGILSFSPVDDDIALTAAASFTFVALASLVYTANMYIWRVIKIRKREAAQYHDYYGPSALCAVLLLAVIVNFSLRLKAGF